jgi:hypothetical protein
MNTLSSIAKSVLQIPQSPPPGPRISQSPSFLLEHLGAMIIAAVIGLGFVFSLWFDVSTPIAPRPTYPYYDTQKPVPPWSEPAPLEGNRNR